MTVNLDGHLQVVLSVPFRDVQSKVTLKASSLKRVGLLKNPTEETHGAAERMGAPVLTFLTLTLPGLVVVLLQELTLADSSVLICVLPRIHCDMRYQRGRSSED